MFNAEPAKEACNPGGVKICEQGAYFAYFKNWV